MVFRAAAFLSDLFFEALPPRSIPDREFAAPHPFHRFRTMKRFAIGGLTFLMLSLLPPTLASAQPGQRGRMASPDSGSGSRMGVMGGMMQRMRGMHSRMMQNPMHRASMMAFVLPALADTLVLSTTQVAQLKELRDELMTAHQQRREQLRARRDEFMGLFEEGHHPAPEAVRNHLRTMADVRVSHRAALYETAEEMRQLLSEEQRRMLDALTPQQQMRLMMASMPMMNMMQMMQMMRPISGGRMQGGKRHRGMPGMRRNL